MSVLALIPLLLTVLVAIGFAHFALRRWSYAQSACVQRATQMQDELGRELRELLAMNRGAQELRRQRDRADSDLFKALDTGFPPLIAAAQLRQDAVIAAQVAYRARQEAILIRAEGTRQRFEREWRVDLAGVEASELLPERFYVRALAVRPEPALSLTPDFVTVDDFRDRQQERLQYGLRFQGRFYHRAVCAVTLESEGLRWRPRLLAASASSSSY